VVFAEVQVRIFRNKKKFLVIPKLISLLNVLARSTVDEVSELKADWSKGASSVKCLGLADILGDVEVNLTTSALLAS